MENEIFVTSLLTDKVRLAPNQVNKNYREIITTYTKLKNEGVCTKYGYIKHNSIEIIKISPGTMRLVSLNGDIIFHVQFKADICNPAIGTVIPAVITNSNKFGILAETSVKVMDDTGKMLSIPVIETVITKQGVGIAGNVDLETLNIGDSINIEVLGKKFELNDKKICVVGKVINTEKGTHVETINEIDTVEVEDLPDDVTDDDDELEEEDLEEEDAEIPEIEGEDEIEGGGVDLHDEAESLFDIDELYDDSDLSGGDGSEVDNDDAVSI